MADDPNTWDPDAPPPWLGQDGSAAFGGDAPPVADASGTPLTPAEESQIQIDAPLGEKTPEQQLDPTLTGAVPTDQQLTPPWLAAAQAGAGTPPTPEADAVSGDPTAPADALTPQQAQDRFNAIATDPKAPLDERSKAWAAMTPDQRTNTLNTTDPKQLAALANDAMTPQELATISVRHNAAKLDEETQRLHAIYTENALKAKQEADAQAKASAYADAESKKDGLAAAALVAKAKQNPNQRGVGRTLADAVLAGIGGAMSQYTGGKNLALESIQKRVEQNIQQQTEEISQGWKGIDLHRNAVATEYARHGDVLRAQGVARIAGLEEAKNALVTDMQNYDPQGTTALSRAQLIQQIGGQQQAAANTLHQQNFKNGMELAKTQTAADAQAETARHNKAGEGVEWAKVGIEKDKAAIGKAGDVVHDPAWFAQQGYKTVPAVAMSVKAFTGVNESNSKAGEIAGKDTENAQKQSSGQILNGNGDPYVKDGKPVQVNPEVAKELNKRIGGGQAYVDEMSKVKRMLAADPSTFDRATWAELNSHLETAAASWTQLYGAKASSRELEAAKEVVGANYEGYASRVKDKGTGIAAIGAQIDSTKRNLNTSLKREAGIKEGADLIDTSEPPPTKEQPGDKADKVLTQNFGASDVNPANEDADDRAFTIAAQKGITSGISMQKDQYAQDAKLSPIATRALHENVAPTQLRAFDDLEADIKGSNDAARAKAVEHLDKIAAGSKSAAVRKYAKGLIEEASSTVLDNAALDTEGGDPIGNRIVHEEAPKKK